MSTTWPPDAVADVLTERFGAYDAKTNPGGYCPALVQHLTGVHATTWARWVEAGQLTEHQADRIGTGLFNSLGIDHADLWPDWHQLELSPEDDAWVASWLAGVA